MSEDKILERLIEVEAIIIEESDKLFHILQEMTQITDNFTVWILRYCTEHAIPIWREEQLRSYVKTSKILLKETGERISYLQELIESLNLPLNKFHKRSPEDLPEPLFLLYKNVFGASGCL